VIEWASVLKNRTIAVVMPAFNEVKLVGSAIESVPSFVDFLIVVDDGSTDDTSRVLRTSRRRVDLLEHALNRGPGAAIATGCRHALALGADLAAVMAADGQMDPADLPSLLEPLMSGEADYVKGDRLAWPLARRAMPWQRWLGNWLLTALTRLALGLDVHDSQCGYVAMSRHTIQTLDWDRLWKSYGYPNDLLSALLAHGLRTHEVPVRPVYGSEQSGIRLRHVLLAIPFVLARAWFRRIARRRGLAQSPSPS
jgi:glycosyltransferase involved in cell wall biosynthesis